MLYKSEGSFLENRTFLLHKPLNPMPDACDAVNHRGANPSPAYKRVISTPSVLEIPHKKTPITTDRFP